MDDWDAHGPAMRVERRATDWGLVSLAIGGFFLMTILLYRGVRGAILLGIVLTAAAGYGLGFGKVPQHVVSLPFTDGYDLSQIALQLEQTLGDPDRYVPLSTICSAAKGRQVAYGMGYM